MRLLSLLVVVLTSVACSFETGRKVASTDATADGTGSGDGQASDGGPGDGTTNGDGGQVDAQPDAVPPPPDAAPCVWGFEPSHLELSPSLPEPEPVLALTMPGKYVLDTDSGQLTPPAGDPTMPASTTISPDGSPVRILLTRALTIGPASVLAVEGSAGLVVLVSGDATLNGFVDVSARQAPMAFTGAVWSQPGPGGNDPACGEAAGGDGAEGGSGRGAGGGGGGAFGASGGQGGAGGAADESGGGRGGVLATEVLSLPLHGGCSGGRGGGVADDLTGEHARGGAGGGAAQLSVCGTLTIGSMGGVRSAGAGGAGGWYWRTAGGGGGSGGLVVLEAASLLLGSGARVCANGGSGGEGSGGDYNMGASGALGLCGVTPATTDDTIESGGNGGDGGYGSHLEGEEGVDGTIATPPGNGGGGGGGGGSAGTIALRFGDILRDPGAVLSPEPVLEEIELAP